MGLLDNARGGTATILDVSGNVQMAAGGESPVAVGRTVPDIMRGATEAAAAAELRRRVAHPTMRPGDRPNPAG